MNASKSPLPVLLIAPIPPILWCGLIYAQEGEVDLTSVFITLALIVMCWGGSWFLVRSTDRLVASRAFVDIHPNLITVSDGYRSAGKFSSETCLIADFDEFHQSLTVVAERRLSESKKLLMLKESVHLRLWPSNCRISRREMDAIVEVAEELFICPEVEVVGASGDHRTAIQA
ncbi:TPA: hypothetical protein ACWLUJ_006175 [Pseudomonas aeruginosa]|nr:hypothetical protein [Pseudomonas aeruginosa]EIU2863522.1 hypothetical protein [Pseudomonas aeruginosa]HEJ2342709.1 hypothetical protein [Pseudomonas aeruginosa]